MQLSYRCVLTVVLVACFKHASANDDAWFNPPGGAWVPDAGMVSLMKNTLDESLRPALEAKADSRMPSARYWFQYVGLGSGVDKVIAIVGRPFPVPPGANAVYMGATIPEACHVFATYLPNEQKIAHFAVGGFHCPPRI